MQPILLYVLVCFSVARISTLQSAKYLLVSTWFA